MSGVPPVFMAAIGTPRALASSSTRLRLSGPRDVKISIDACASHATVAGRSIQPTKRMSLRDCRACASICARSGPSPTMTSGQSRSRLLDDVHEVRRAFVRGELAEIERVRLRQRWRGRGRARTQAADIHGIGDDFEACRRDLGRSRTKVGGDGRAHGHDRIGPRKAGALAREVQLHVRNHRQRQWPQRAAARPNAARHHSRRTLGAQRRGLVRVNEIGPIADRPVVAHRADGRDIVPMRRLDRRAATSARADRARARRPRAR